MALTGCGIYSLSSNTLDAQIKTISIQYFPNYAEIVNPSLSQIFTEALKNQFLSQTKLNLINSNGDIQLEGKIVTYRIAPIAIAGGNASTAQMTRLTIGVSVKYTNRFNHQKDFEKTFERFEDYDAQKARSSSDDIITITNITKTIIQDDIYKAVAEDW